MSCYCTMTTPLRLQIPYHNQKKKKKTFNTTSEKWYNFGFGGLVTKFVGLNIFLIGLDIFVNIY